MRAPGRDLYGQFFARTRALDHAENIEHGHIHLIEAGQEQERLLARIERSVNKRNEALAGFLRPHESLFRAGHAARRQQDRYEDKSCKDNARRGSDHHGVNAFLWASVAATACNMKAASGKERPFLARTCLVELAGSRKSRNVARDPCVSARLALPAPYLPACRSARGIAPVCMVGKKPTNPGSNS